MRADDRIIWMPANYPHSVVMEHGLRIHRCDTAVLANPVTRESLDPMALGACRYCKEPLPE